MEMEILGTVYTGVSDDFQRGIYPIARTIKAEKHDLGIVIKEISCGGGDGMDVKKLGNIYGFDGGSYAGNVYSSEYISPTINTMGGGNREPMIVAMRGRNPDNPSDRTAGSPTEQRLEPNSQGICNTLTTVQKDCLVLENIGTAPTLRGETHGNLPKVIESQYRIRKLTPIEVWRLMGFSDEDFHKAESVNSNSQLYKQAGNSIVKDCLMAIFRQLGINGVKRWNEMD